MSARETTKVLRQAYNEKEAEAAALREALEAILEQPGLYVHMFIQLKEQARAALSADAGREMLERVRALERTIELLVAAGHVTQETVDKARAIALSFRD